MARNEKTGEQSYHKVSQTFATPNDEIYDLELTRQDGKSDVLGVTGNHPFWLKGKGWTESDLLKAGDLVAGKDGTWLKVNKLTLRGDKQTAYNLEVEQDHTYFVGLAGAWVHNACDLGGAIPKVADRKLANIVSDLYKGAKGPNPIGTGNTADAIRNELATGLPTGGRFHSQKGAEYITALEKWLAKSPDASHYDRLVGESLKLDLQNALGR